MCWIIFCEELKRKGWAGLELLAGWVRREKRTKENETMGRRKLKKT